MLGEALFLFIRWGALILQNKGDASPLLTNTRYLIISLSDGNGNSSRTQLNKNPFQGENQIDLVLSIYVNQSIYQYMKYVSMYKYVNQSICLLIYK